jgi:hypothetical protein|tara:strand:+ start:908 stop:1399 length:492 start_codon:yes stop_codon:yes gene_type:complete
MAYEKLQGYLAQEVIVSDNTNIIYPSLAVEGATSVPVANQLTAAGAVDFEAEGIFAGDIVVNSTTGLKATVLSIVDKVTLIINTDIFLVQGEAFKVYNASAFKNYQDANNGCVLYIGGAGDLKVDTIAGSTVTFKAVPVGFFPVQVKKIYSTGTVATDIIALW